MKRSMTVPLVVLAAATWTACDCGKKGPGYQDTSTDGEDTAGDTTLDGEDLPDAGDTEDEDGAMPARPFTCESAGGGTISSENYTIELFAAPVRPTGTTSNENYTIKLGPAGARSR